MRRAAEPLLLAFAAARFERVTTPSTCCCCIGLRNHHAPRPLPPPTTRDLDRSGGTGTEADDTLAAALLDPSAPAPPLHAGCGTVVVPVPEPFNRIFRVDSAANRVSHPLDRALRFQL